MPLDKKSKRKLKWVLDLIQTDVEVLPKPEWGKMLYELLEEIPDIWDAVHFSGKVFDSSLRVVDKITIFSTEESRRIFSEVQRKVLDELLALVDKLRSDNQHGIIDVSDPDKILRHIDIELKKSNDPDALWKKNKPIIESGVSESFPITFHAYVSSDGQIKVSRNFEPSLPHKMIVYELLNLLDGVPLDSLKKCLECGKIFAHLSKRERQFCSNPCASRYLVREKREALKKDPVKYEEYLKKQRETMKARYRAKVLGKEVKKE